MPIFFVVSGINGSYALKKRTIPTYLKERWIRLGIPLIFGVFFLTPPQVYLERLANYQFQGSFLEFIPHFFDGIYLDFGGTGNFAFFGLHLWYLLVLLVFSFLTIPLFHLVLKRNTFGMIHFVLLPLILFIAGTIHTQSLGGWDLVFYLILFIYGHYFFSSTAFKPALRSTIKYHIPIAVGTSIIYIFWFMVAYPQPGSLQSGIFYALRTVNGWSLLLCFFYLANKYLSFSNRFLKYGSEASMPFYVLHQPVIVILGYYIKDLSLSIPLKLLVLSSLSFIVIMLCYHLVIKRFAILRVLFGMKLHPKAKHGDGSHASEPPSSSSVNIHKS